MPQTNIKIIIAVITSAYFLWCAFTPESGSLFSYIHIPIHEAGHGLFSGFGEFMYVAGGSIFQTALPLIFFCSLIYKEKPFSASIVLFWIGNSIITTSIYIGDAQIMALPLINMSLGSNDGIHDWNYLLDALGILKYTSLIAAVTRIIGTIITFMAVFGVFYYALKNSEILFAEEE